jgi:aminopeptidase-like protein
MYDFIKKILKINRSLTGDGNRKTLKEIKKVIKKLSIKEIKSGTKVYDWKIPLEWNIKNAYIQKPDGSKICEFKKNFLHVVGYSIKMNKKLKLNQLKKHLFSLPSQPNAIPYVTSYYKKFWGFCLTDKEKKKLKPGYYKVLIDSNHSKGSMSYGEYIKKGKNKKEILLSTYICHPTMANNEGSGITILTYVAKYLSKLKTKFTYRIVYSPETIGSLAYLSKNYNHLKKNIIGGYVLTCIGDEKKFSLLKSRNKNSITDYAAEHVLNSDNKKYNLFEWNQRGSDERQYCAPKIDLPISSIMRSKYYEYKEYHTSLDKLDKVVTAKGLRESYEYVVKIINLLEKSYYLLCTFPGEPHLGKRNLYPNISVKNNKNLNRDLLNILTWSDGKTPTFEIMNKCNLTNKKFVYLLNILLQHRLISKSEVPI